MSSNFPIEILKQQTKLNKRIVNFETWDTISPAYMEYYVQSSKARPGASAPTQALRAIGASGGVYVTVEQFSLVVQQDLHFEFHAFDEMDNTTPIQFHLMWLPGAAWTTGNYLWKLEYLIKTEGDPYNTGTPQIIQMNVTPLSAVNWIETEFTNTIPLQRGQILYCHFYRDVAGDNADSTGDVDFFEFKYRKDRNGSAT